MTHIFIVNPYSERNRVADTLREKLSKIEGLNYFVFNTRSAGYEEIIVRKIRHFFEGEELRFYCCGGSGTIRNVLCGFDDISQAEVAFIPCGMTNDFLKVFDCGEEPFRDIEALINGDVINVDVIKSNYGYALNTVSFGLDAEMGKKLADYYALTSIAGWLPYTLAILSIMFSSNQYRYTIEIDDKTIDQTCIEVIFGNGNVLGGNLIFSDSRDAADGLCSYYICKEVHGLNKVSVLLNLMSKDMDKVRKHAACGFGNEIKIRRTDGKNFDINLDGEILKNITEFEARIIKQGLRFVVPKGIMGGEKREQ